MGEDAVSKLAKWSYDSKRREKRTKEMTHDAMSTLVVKNAWCKAMSGANGKLLVIQVPKLCEKAQVTGMDSVW